LFEAGVYGDEVAPLLAEVRRQGMAAEVLPFQALLKDRPLAVGGRALAAGDCVVGYGTFPFARHIQLHRRWVPGAWCSPERLDCTAYFAYFGKFLLNQHYAILPVVEAVRQRDWLYGVFARDDVVFARPAGCHKVFTGRCIARDDFAAAVSPARSDPATLVVVAAPRDIAREWRLVIAEGRVIGASQYAEGGGKSVAPGCPADVRAFAEALLAEVRWRPDPVFMADVGEAEGRLWLIELNGFSCSWLYQSDLSAVVAEASRCATAAWEQALAEPPG
jgi:hypothetical protein